MDRFTELQAELKAEVPAPRASITTHVAESDLECLFYSEAEAAARLGLHRTTLRALALQGRAPIEPIALTEHRRVYRRIEVHRLAGLEE